jgi:hypothetical protein
MSEAFHRCSQSNEDILEELKVDSVENKLAKHKQKWIIMSAGWKTRQVKTTPRLMTYRKNKMMTTTTTTTIRLIDGYNCEA